MKTERMIEHKGHSFMTNVWSIKWQELEQEWTKLRREPTCQDCGTESILG